jgi:hypothetical protein
MKMSKLIESTVILIATDTTLTNNTAATLSTEVDFRKCIGGMIQVEFQFDTAPEADKTIDVYMLPAAASGGNFDIYDQGHNILLCSVKVAAVTEVQRLSCLFDSVNCPYGKLAVYNNGTGQTVTLKALTLVARKVA